MMDCGECVTNFFRFRCPWVSARRLEEREREVLELRRELADLKHVHERLLDHSHFEKTGFHLYERYASE
jgi:hypothetical protein